MARQAKHFPLSARFGTLWDMDTKRVLIVEDDPELSSIMQEALEDEGYEVRMVSEGARAYAETVAFQPDAILLDLMMPEVDGYDIGRQLRKNDRTASIPIIIVSGYKRLEDAEILLKTRYSLQKPFDIVDLVTKVEDALDGRLPLR